MRLKFPPALRLHSQDEISNVFNNGRKLTRNSVAIFFCPNSFECARLAVVVPKKNIHGAVQRNKFKRVARESFRLQQHYLRNVDVIVFIYATAKSLTKSQLRLCLDKHWQELIGRLPK